MGTMNMAASLDQSLGIFDYLPKPEPPSLSNSMSDLGSGTSSMRSHEEEDEEQSGESQGFAHSFSSSFPACASSTTTDTTATTTTTTTTATTAVKVSVGAITTGTRKRTASSRAQGGSDDKRQKKLELNRLASRESRKRKKRRLEELQRSVIYLTHENHGLRDQNELLRNMLITRLPPSEVAEALGGVAGGVGGGAGAVAGAAARAAAAGGLGGMGLVVAKEEVVEEEDEEEDEEEEGLQGLEGGHGLGSSMSSAAVDFFLPHMNMKESSDVIGGEGRLPMVGAA